MNGSGTPVSGAIPSTTKMLRMPWHRISEVSPLASSLRIAGGRAPGRPQPGVGDHPVEAGDAEDPEDAELLADHRQDEVGLRLWEVVGLLHGVAEADAEDPAGADRDLALDGLVARRRTCTTPTTGAGRTAAVRAGTEDASTISSTTNATTPAIATM